MVALIILVMFFTFYSECAYSQDTNNTQLVANPESSVAAITPSQFASQALKNSLYGNEVKEPHRNSHFMQHQESRTSAFQKSFINYVKNIYNKQNYTQALSQDGSHIIQFLEICNEMGLKHSTVYVCMRLFYNKIKGCEIIEDGVALNILNSMPELLGHYFVPEQDEEFHYDLGIIKRQQEDIIISQLTNHIPSLQTQPELFVNDLAQELSQHCQQIMSGLEKSYRKMEDCERLRNIIIRFFDVMLGKLIWDARNHNGIWQSFIDIAQGLMHLASFDIIKHMDDLDDFLWTLTLRFCFFLDLAGALLPISFYESIEQDLEECSIPFLECKEQDEGITSKKETLINSLIKARAQAVAYEKNGIITTSL